MNYLKNIIRVLRLDKLFTTDILELAGFYMTVAFHIIMFAFIIWLFKWFLFISC